MNQTGPRQICAQAGHTWSHSDHLLSVHQAPRPPSGLRSCNCPLGISTWMLQRQLKFHTFKTGLLLPPATPASHLPFTHQAAHPGLTFALPTSQVWSVPHLLALPPLPTSPRHEPRRRNSPSAFLPATRATVKCKRFLAENQSIGS